MEKDRANRLHFRKFPASHCAPLAGSPARAFSLRSLVTKTRMQRHGSLFPKEHPLASYRPTTNPELPGLALRGPGGRPSGRSSAEGRVRTAPPLLPLGRPQQAARTYRPAGSAAPGARSPRAWHMERRSPRGMPGRVVPSSGARPPEGSRREAAQRARSGSAIIL